MKFIEIFSGVVVRKDTVTAIFLIEPSPNATSRLKWRVQVNATATHQKEFESEEAAKHHLRYLKAVLE